MANNSRPVFLNLLQIRFPVTAIISVLHRVSGVLLILVLPMWLWLLQQALLSLESYLQLEQLIAGSFFLKMFIWLGLITAWYHVLAGIRHICMDFGFFEKMCAAKTSAWLLLVVTVCSALFLGCKIWF